MEDRETCLLSNYHKTKGTDMIYTYTKLIQGAAFSYNVCAALQRKAKRTGDTEAALYYSGQCSYFKERLAHFRLMRSIVGDETIIRR